MVPGPTFFPPTLYFILYTYTLNLNLNLYFKLKLQLQLQLQLEGKGEGEGEGDAYIALCTVQQAEENHKLRMKTLNNVLV